jgi:hypothetical protein
MPPRKPEKIYRLKVTLAEVEPPVWRRLLVPADVTLARLHSLLQTAMGWTDSHLHCFEVGDSRFGMASAEEGDVEDERRVRLDALLQRKGQKLLYRYDYGDDWEHIVSLEGSLEPDSRLAYPLCEGGARACPPEDCGGPWGYDELLRVVSDPKHEEHDDIVSWLGGPFDPEAFDANAVNRQLRRVR